jgi:hypothetical protein
MEGAASSNIRLGSRASAFTAALAQLALTTSLAGGAVMVTGAL